MELFSPAWLTALLAIVLIDLVLAGDNAIVIALAARRAGPQPEAATALARLEARTLVRASYLCFNEGLKGSSSTPTPSVPAAA